MASKIGPSTGTSGKGANFTSRPNLFDVNKNIGRAPELSTSKAFVSVADEVLQAGCLLMLGYTRDGGALVVTIIEGEQRHRSYASTEQELDGIVLALHEYFGGDD